MKNYQHINKETPVRLRSLITSGDIESNTLIGIFDKDGHAVCKGEWYRDYILDHGDKFGTAHKAGTGRTVHFQFV